MTENQENASATGQSMVQNLFLLPFMVRQNWIHTHCYSSRVELRTVFVEAKDLEDARCKGSRVFEDYYLVSTSSPARNGFRLGETEVVPLIFNVVNEDCYGI